MPNPRQIFMVVLALALLSAAAMLFPAQSSAADDRPLRIGFPSWIAYDVFVHAQQTRLFEKHGVEVELICFDETSDVAWAVMSGGLDAGFSGIATLIANHDGTPLDIILLTSISSGADGVVARPGIETVADLRGARVGCKLRATNRLILAEALDHHGLSMDDITIADVSNAAAEQMLREGSIDAAVLWEPRLSKVAEAVGGRVIHRTSDLDSVVLDSLVTRSELATGRADEFLAIREVWFELLDRIDEDPEAVFRSLAPVLRQSPDDLANAWTGVVPVDRELNRRTLGPGFDRTFGRIVEFMEAEDLSGIRPTALDPSFGEGR